MGYCQCCATIRKSVLDAWNGYHGLEIDEADRHTTTFLTEYGRYQYRTTPLGFIASGDGYSMRMDTITGDDSSGKVGVLIQ